MRRLMSVLGVFTLALLTLNPAASAEDCDAGFLTFVGAGAYQFSPEHKGELGTVRLFAILSFEDAAAHGEPGVAAWRLDITGPDGKPQVVASAEGLLRLDEATALAEHFWDGRETSGLPVAPGKYQYTFRARFLPDAAGRAVTGYDALAGVLSASEARESTDEVIVDYTLREEQAWELRQSLRATTCQAHQNTPLEAGLGYNFYYGSTHSHSNWSDGGQSTLNCSSGNGYGTGSVTPAAAYTYARDVAELDFWVINEHNHLIADAISNNNPPLTAAKVRQRYQDGRAAAVAATQDDVFVALYGMEWGVTSNSDQGHVTLIETPVLFGWEPCTTCNGPNPECTLGSNCEFDVFTPKRFGYTTLWQRSTENPSPAGALGILCHPSSGNFDGLAYSAAGDNALQGIAVRSGLAFATAENCGDANVGSTDYSSQWRTALDKGFHLGPVADHDSHCNNYGQALPTRTVYLIPNGSTPVLTRNNLMAAHKARHFFASEDANAQLVFTASNGAVMGDVTTAAGSLTLRAAVYDPTGEGVSTIEIWRDQVGGGAPTAAYRSASNQTSFAITEALTSGSYFYWVRAVQADGHDLWSAPIWVTYSPGGCTDTEAPTVEIMAPANGATLACTDTVVRVNARDANGIASVQVQIDGGAWTDAPYNSATGNYELPWAASAVPGAHTLLARATDASCGANQATSGPTAVTVDPAGCSVDVSGYRVVQANSAITYTLPAGTRVARGGYVVIARSATKAQFETFWRAGVALPSNVTFINSGGAFPQINGSETYTLNNAGGTRLDGVTVAMSSSAGQSLRRKDPCNTPGTSANWNIGATSTATPGSGAGPGTTCAKGLMINEFSDATGTNNFVYEFVELYFDP